MCSRLVLSYSRYDKKRSAFAKSVCCAVLMRDVPDSSERDEGSHDIQMRTMYICSFDIHDGGARVALHTSHMLTSSTSGSRSVRLQSSSCQGQVQMQCSSSGHL